jgi:hypothetical protein
LIISDKNITSQIRVLFGKWEKRFREDCRKTEPFTVFAPSRSFLKDHIEFIRIYLGHMMLDGTSRENLKRIKRFLALQKRKNDVKKMAIHFLHGNPYEIIVFVETLNDIDIADVFGMIKFGEMHVFKGKNKRWTKKSAETFIKELENDLACDGYEARFNYDYSKDTLEIACWID